MDALLCLLYRLYRPRASAVQRRRSGAGRGGVGLLLLACALTASGPGLAQPEPGAAPDSPMAQRLSACTACHGAAGIELEGGYVPRIHGKPAGYLYNQLINYRENRRHNRTMTHMVAPLSPGYLQQIAEYFAGLHPPYPPPAAAPATALAERGETLVREGDAEAGIPACAACHGERLTGVEPNTPGLVGLPRHYIAAQLGAWRVGARQAAAPDCMAKIAHRLDGRDIEAVAAWLASRPTPADARPAAERVEAPPLECGSVAPPQAAS